MLSETARAALERAGASPGRRVDTGAFERALAGEGFVLSDAARALLAVHGGLRVSLPHPRLPKVTIDFDFDAARAASGIERESVEALAARAGGPLCPVGHALGGTLLVDENGAVYAALDEWLARLGATAEEAVETLCAGGSGVPAE